MKVIQCLASVCDMLAAGDGFQDLADDATNAAIAWARETGERTPLSSIHRTSVSGLLAAAQALRAGGAVPKKALGFEIVDRPTAPMGAWFAARFIAERDKGDSVVLLSPAGPKRSPFVYDLGERLAAGMAPKHRGRARDQ